jgi:molybdopterin converting factor small subunit
LVGEAESGSAFTFFGPVRAGLTTSQATSKEAQLSELLSSLEKEVENLRSKYCEAYITLISVMEHLVKLNSLLLNTDTTKLKDS